jgi:hypothetical protein
MNNSDRLIVSPRDECGLPKARKFFRTARHALPHAHPLVPASMPVNNTSTNSTLASPPKVGFPYRRDLIKR